MSTPALEARVDIRRTPLELLLKVLDVDGSVRRVQGGWVATGQPWTYDEERYERIAESRRAEQESMLAYERGEGCRMELLQRELDDPTAAPCGRCDICAGPWYPADATPEAVAAASGALDRVGVQIEPRASGPPGPADSASRPTASRLGKIAEDERPETGRAVARLTDLGWGGVLRELFAAGAPDAPVSDELLGGCVRVLSDWDWAERPVGVVACRPWRDPSSSSPWPRASPGSAGCRCSGSSSSPTGRAAEPGRQQRLPPGRRVGAFRVGPDLAAALSDGVRAGAAGRRPRRQPLDDDRRRPRAAAPRCRLGAAVRAGAPSPRIASH